jgi:transcriptional regulator with XRE-family HTH domain
MSAARKINGSGPREIEPTYAVLGMRIKKLREKKGLTQTDVADSVGLTRVSVTNIELGRQRLMLSDVNAFADALQVTPQTMLKGIFW